MGIFQMFQIIVSFVIKLVKIVTVFLKLIVQPVFPHIISKFLNVLLHVEMGIEKTQILPVNSVK